MMSLKINEENAEEELREAFRVFDGVKVDCFGNVMMSRFFQVFNLGR